mmetsp:Transcript_2051/g.6584  ORF Transcript_2051/g.6584 Transcript_2051/m.6584 type:complete len:269 (+) Transcript_2051:261-1067(+)
MRDVAGDRDRLHGGGPVALALGPDVHEPLLATRRGPLAEGRRGGLLRPQGQLRAVAAPGLPRRLVVRSDAAAVEEARAVVAGLVVPDALVQLRGLQGPGRPGSGQAGRRPGAPHGLPRPLVEERVEEALAALGPHEVAPRRRVARVRPARALIEGRVGREALRRPQQPAVGPHRKEAHVQGLPDAPAGAQEVACGGATQHGPHVPMELDVLVIEGHGIVLVPAEDVQAHEVLRPAPVAARGWYPVPRPPTQARWDGPGHLDQLDAVLL